MNHFEFVCLECHEAFPSDRIFLDHEERELENDAEDWVKKVYRVDFIECPCCTFKHELSSPTVG